MPHFLADHMSEPIDKRGHRIRDGHAPSSSRMTHPIFADELHILASRQLLIS